MTNHTILAQRLHNQLEIVFMKLSSGETVSYENMKHLETILQDAEKELYSGSSNIG